MQYYGKAFQLKYLTKKTPTNSEDIDLSLKEQNNENNLIKQIICLVLI